MSTRPRPQSDFIQGGQSTVEQDASPAALFYLFQEVSKLTSPVHCSFLDTNSPSKWHNETSRQDNFRPKNEDDDACSFQSSTSSCQHSLSYMSTYNQVNAVKEGSHRSMVATLLEPRHECSSPWKVLSLINLQCERLMHRREVEESNPSSGSPTKSAHPTAASVVQQKPTTTSLLICERHEIGSSIHPVEDVSKSKPHCCAKDHTVDYGIKPQTAEKHSDKMEIMFSPNGQLVCSQECKMGSFSPEQNILNLPFSENALQQMQILRASQNTDPTFDLNTNASVALSKPALTLDYNSNYTLTTEPQCETPVPTLSSILPSSLVFSSSKCQSLPEQDEEFTGSQPERTGSPTEDESTPVLKSYNVPSSSKINHSLGQKEDNSQQWKTKTPRKQPHPSRSVDIQDPYLQGVSFRMDTEVDDSKEQCRLLITSKFRYSHIDSNFAYQFRRL